VAKRRRPIGRSARCSRRGATAARALERDGDGASARRLDARAGRGRGRARAGGDGALRWDTRSAIESSTSGRISSRTCCASAGSAQDVLVGVCVPRSARMVIAPAGDPQGRRRLCAARPEYPPARLGQIFEDASARVVLSEVAVESVLPEHGSERILLDRDAAALQRRERRAFAARSPGRAIWRMCSSPRDRPAGRRAWRSSTTARSVWWSGPRRSTAPTIAPACCSARAFASISRCSSSSCR
jgi:non-ribosomal peptide synthetase component F